MPLQNGERCCRRFHSARNICKRKKCDYDFTHKKCGYFHSHTCVFGQLYCDFYAGLKDKCQLPVGVYNDPVERFEHERIRRFSDSSFLCMPGQQGHRQYGQPPCPGGTDLLFQTWCYPFLARSRRSIRSSCGVDSPYSVLQFSLTIWNISFHSRTA